MKTFRIGGVHPQDNKSYSANQPIVECPLPKHAIVPLVQHIGAPTQPVVAVGDKVKVKVSVFGNGELIQIIQ